MREAKMMENISILILAGAFSLLMFVLGYSYGHLSGMDDAVRVQYIEVGYHER